MGCRVGTGQWINRATDLPVLQLRSAIGSGFLVVLLVLALKYLGPLLEVHMWQ